MIYVFFSISTIFFSLKISGCHFTSNSLIIWFVAFVVGHCRLSRVKRAQITFFLYFYSDNDKIDQINSHEHDQKNRKRSSIKRKCLPDMICVFRLKMSTSALHVEKKIVIAHKTCTQICINLLKRMYVCTSGYFDVRWQIAELCASFFPSLFSFFI